MCIIIFFWIWIYHFFFNTSKIFFKNFIDLCLLSNFSQKLIKPSQMSDPSDVPSGCQIQNIRGLCFWDCLISVCDMGSDAVFNLWCIRNPGWTTGPVIAWNSQKKTSTNHRGGAIAQRVNVFSKRPMICCFRGFPLLCICEIFVYPIVGQNLSRSATS